MPQNSIFSDFLGSFGVVGSGNPIVDILSAAAPFLGLGFAGPRGGLAGLTLLSDQTQAAYRNEQAEALTERLFDSLDRGREDFIRLQQNLPGVSLNGQTFAPQGHTGQTLSLDDAFRGPEAGLNFFRNNVPGANLPGLNFGNQMERSTQGLQAGRDQLAGAGARTSQLASGIQSLGESFARGDSFGAIPKIDTDLSAVQNARLSGAGASSRERERQLMESLAGAAPMAGGLEGIQRDQLSASQEESFGRALEAQNIVGQTRQEQLAAEQFNAQLEAARQQAGFQAGVGGIAQDLAAALALGQSGADLEQTGAQRDVELGMSEQVSNNAILAQNLQRQLDLFGTELGLEQAVGNADTERLMTALQAAFQQSGLGGQFTQAGTGNETAGFGIIQPRLLPQDFGYTSLLQGLFPDIFGS